MKREFRSDINALRALAVVLVVLYHFGLPGFGGGYIGVDIFFVISGYLMTGIIVSGADQPYLLWKFYLSRAKRIIPALIVMIAVTTTVCWWMLDPADYKQLAGHAFSSLLFFSNEIYAREAGYFDQAAHAKWFLHTWSLSVEWQFYLLIPIFILAVRRFTASHKLLLLTFVVIASFLYIGGALRTQANPAWHFYSLTSRAWEMLAGGLTYLAGRGSRPAAGQKLTAILGGTFIVAGMVLAAQKPIWPGWLALVPVAGTALVILAARETRLASNRIIGWIGQRSYSIYLWHWPVVVYLSLGEHLDDFRAISVALLATLVLSELSYRYVEVPASAAFRASPVRWITVAALALVGGIAATFLLYMSDGVAGRLGTDAATIDELNMAGQDWGFLAGQSHEGRISADLASVPPSPAVTAVLGDSHAEQWYPRFETENSRPARIVFLTRGGCLPFPGYDRVDIVDQCGQFAAEAWADVFKLKPNRLVITAQWLNYFLDRSGKLTAVSCVMTGITCAPVDGQDKLNSLCDLLRDKIRQAKDSGIDIVLMGPIPFTQKSYVEARIQAISAMHLPLSPNPKADASLLAGFIDEEQFHRFAAPITDELVRIAGEAGIAYIDPALYMCTAGKCPLAGSDGAPLYKDGSHLRPRTVRSDAMKWLDSIFFGT